MVRYDSAALPLQRMKLQAQRVGISPSGVGFANSSQTPAASQNKTKKVRKRLYQTLILSGLIDWHRSSRLYF